MFPWVLWYHRTVDRCLRRGTSWGLGGRVIGAVTCIYLYNTRDRLHVRELVKSDIEAGVSESLIRQRVLLCYVIRLRECVCGRLPLLPNLGYRRRSQTAPCTATQCTDIPPQQPRTTAHAILDIPSALLYLSRRGPDLLCLSSVWIRVLRSRPFRS
jgi:hypothetical protein